MGPSYWIKIDGITGWKRISEAEYRNIMLRLAYGERPGPRNDHVQTVDFAVEGILGCVTNGEDPDHCISAAREHGLLRSGFREGIDAAVKYLEENPMKIPFKEITFMVNLTEHIKAIKALEYGEL